MFEKVSEAMRADVSDERSTVATRSSEATVLVALVHGAATLLRANTGATIWRAQTGAEEITGLAHGDDIVYLALSSGRRPEFTFARGEALFQPTPDSRDANGDPIYERDPSGRSQYHVRTERVDTRFDLARIEARRASDGALLWSFTNTRLGLLAYMALVGPTLVLRSNGLFLGVSGAFGLDARTGDVRWRRAYRVPEPSDNGVSPLQPDHTQLGRFFVTGDGRLYVNSSSAVTVRSVDRPGQIQAQTYRWLEALDVATGITQWRQPVEDIQQLALSTGGALIAYLTWADVGSGLHMLTARATADGASVGTLTYRGELRSITDNGAVHVMEEEAGIPSVHTYHIGDAAQGNAHNTATSTDEPSVTLHTRDFRRNRNGHDELIEIRALDSQTGALRWVWQSPRNLIALLRLWRLRAPAALAASIYRQLRKAGPRLWQWGPHELRAGLWRHPAALGVWNSRVDVIGDTVYIGSRLGVFALCAQDGALRWTGLPNREVATSIPIATPKSSPV